MGCDDPINQTEHVSFNLKKDTDADPLLQALDENKQVIDLTGYTFLDRFLDEEGGTILSTSTAALYGAPTNGIFRPFYMDKATNNALIALATPPTFWELFAILDGVQHKWLTADVGIEPAGSAP